MSTAERAFYTSHQNSTFIAQRMEAGKPVPGILMVLKATGHFFHTSDQDAIAQLVATAALPGSPLTEVPADAAMQDLKLPRTDEQRPFEEVKERAAEVVSAIAKAGQRA